MKATTAAITVVLLCFAIARASGYFMPSRCPYGCSSCSYSRCFRCSSGFFLHKTACLSQCPSGYFGLSAYGISICAECRVSGCRTCTTRDNCLECSSGYLDTTSSSPMCSYTCPKGTYKSSTFGGKRCIACSTPNCAQCYSSTSCSECKPAFYKYYPSVLAEVQCVSECPVGYTVDFSYGSRSCTKCGVEGCTRCYSSSARDKCFGCEPGKFVLEQTSCVSRCPEGYEEKPLSGEMYCSKIPTTTIPTPAAPSSATTEEQA
ncbi:proprotein convertase subtilisin/kexin type 5 [Lingula anatina]|uniref:Proprotein convertase subtilisin/kexin type 5 n=1 Tax=Lingula anatina TaxID=7574 RepID=A0A1S3HCX8_LINAN|nr:proprotein convertase subtilisin/kexin type 5 [Lingula anatina]|eukprot:XP_013383381.1 proprotein convertase subtilisin/kexin type 5 [Lingula anatina]